MCIQCGGRHVFWSIQYVNLGPARPRSWGPRLGKRDSGEMGKKMKSGCVGGLEHVRPGTMNLNSRTELDRDVMIVFVPS